MGIITAQVLPSSSSVYTDEREVRAPDKRLKSTNVCYSFFKLCFCSRAQYIKSLEHFLILFRLCFGIQGFWKPAVPDEYQEDFLVSYRMYINLIQSKLWEKFLDNEGRAVAVTHRFSH